jgi:hypothetical protein
MHERDDQRKACEEKTRYNCDPPHAERYGEPWDARSQDNLWGRGECVQPSGFVDAKAECSSEIDEADAKESAVEANDKRPK